MITPDVMEHTSTDLASLYIIIIARDSENGLKVESDFKNSTVEIYNVSLPS